MQIDRRKNARNKVEIASELHLPDKTVFRGKIQNVSFSGAYFICNRPDNISVGTACILRLILQAGRDARQIQINCMVVRKDDKGAGIKFVSVDLDGYQQFKNFMVYNSPDPNTLLEELEKNPGLEIRK
ncbi:MAG: PilZ domain-containing protein [Nitrospirae bacterium]|nr:PilZ domain-containing protein [Nitrospirota bacterium]